MKHVTIKDIARQLALSVSTVSRALAGDKNIRRETKEKVLEAARQLGYTPNPVATNLKYGRTHTVGVIVPEMVTPFAAGVIRGVQRLLYAKGLKAIIADSAEDPRREKENLQLMERFRVDGMIVCLCSYLENQDEYRRLQQAGMPMVFYDRIPRGLEATQVIVDDYAKSFLLVEHLVRGGRRRIVYVEGPSGLYNSIERKRGYADALAKFRLPADPELLVSSGLNFDDGARVADRLLEKGVAFDALFAFTDTVAIGAMNRLRERGLRIPQEVAVAGFSGTSLSTIVYPGLTTIEPPLLRMGETAAGLLLEKIDAPATPARSVVLPAEIRLRASTEWRSPCNMGGEDTM